MKILLVDPDGNRAEVLGDALTAGGASVTVAASGSFALTMLEWDRHDVIVSRARLGDMEGHELCAILRDDPGMKELRFALIAGADEVNPSSGPAGIDVILPSTMPPPAMLARITRLVPDVAPPAEAPSPLAEPPAAGPTVEIVPVEPAVPDTRAVALREVEESSGSFAGALDDVGLGELARAIVRARRTGHLLIALPTEGGAVAFESGHVIHADFHEEGGAAAFAALIGAAQRARIGDFCFMVDETGLRGTPHTIHETIDELSRGS